MDQIDSRAIEVVAGLIAQEGRVLICQRNAASKFPLKWEFPGGKIEPGEQPAEALRRELREELAIDIEESKEFLRYVHHYKDMPPVELRFFQIMSYHGEIKNLIFQQIVWTPVTKLAQFDFLEGDLPLIKRLMGGYPVGLTA